jgi:hypothetical protein
VSLTKFCRDITAGKTRLRTEKRKEVKEIKKERKKERAPSRTHAHISLGLFVFHFFSGVEK